MLSLFLFSSRRRHTRWPRDWSSDVCSSDLRSVPGGRLEVAIMTLRMMWPLWLLLPVFLRSEERRVGKECRSLWAADRAKQKRNDDVDIIGGSSSSSTYHKRFTLDKTVI